MCVCLKIKVYGGLSYQKFKSQWQYWVTDTESKLLTGFLSNETDLEEIIKVFNSLIIFIIITMYCIFCNFIFFFFNANISVDKW